VAEITDPAWRGNLWFCLGSTTVRCGLAMAGAKWRRFGDEGEAMLFVLIYWGKCGLGDGEEMSLL